MTDLDTLLQQVGASFASNAPAFSFVASTAPAGIEIPGGYGSIPGYFPGTGGRDSFVGTSGADVMIGLAGNDTLKGNGGEDILSGGDGNDVLTGGSGMDIFVFNTRLNKFSNVDRIIDYNSRADTMVLDRDIFTKAGRDGILKSTAFVEGKRAMDAGDRIVYDKATGALFYDRDGTGAAAQVKFAQLKAGTALNFSDFAISTITDYGIV